MLDGMAISWQFAQNLINSGLIGGEIGLIESSMRQFDVRFTNIRVQVPDTTSWRNFGSDLESAASWAFSHQGLSQVRAHINFGSSWFGFGSFSQSQTTRRIDTPLADKSGFRKELKRRLGLNNGECRNKLNKLLEELDKKFEDKKAGLTGFDALAEKFLGSKDKLLEKMSGYSNYNSGTGKLTMNVDPSRGAGFGTLMENTGIEFIHELLHAASNSSFSHERIVKEISKIEGLDFAKLEAGQRAEDLAKGNKKPNDSALFEAPMNAWLQKYCGGNDDTWKSYLKYK